MMAQNSDLGYGNKSADVEYQRNGIHNGLALSESPKVVSLTMEASPETKWKWV